MDSLKKKPVAILIVLAVMALSTLLSVNRTLGAKCQEITDGFYEGVFDDGYRQPGISSHLSVRLDRSNSIVSIASNYAELQKQAEAVKQAREYLLAATESKDISAQFDKNAALQKTVEALRSAAEGMQFSERDRKILDACFADFDGAQNSINKSAYNETVREFYRSTLNVFPTKFLASVSGVKAPELFE